MRRRKAKMKKPTKLTQMEMNLLHKCRQDPLLVQRGKEWLVDMTIADEHFSIPTGQSDYYEALKRLGAMILDRDGKGVSPIARALALFDDGVGDKMLLDKIWVRYAALASKRGESEQELKKERALWAEFLDVLHGRVPADGSEKVPAIDITAKRVTSLTMPLVMKCLAAIRKKRGIPSTAAYSETFAKMWATLGFSSERIWPSDEDERTGRFSIVRCEFKPGEPEKLIAAAPMELKFLFAFGAYTALPLGCVKNITWEMFDPGLERFTCYRRNSMLYVPVHPQLKAVLEPFKKTEGYLMPEFQSLSNCRVARKVRDFLMSCGYVTDGEERAFGRKPQLYSYQTFRHYLKEI